MEKIKIGLVQQVIGQIGGNDMVLKSLIVALKDYDVTVYTFSKASMPGVKVIYKIPFNIPLFGIYQKLLMPQFKYKDDIVISLTGYKVKTDKPLITFDQNNNDAFAELPQKYKHGFWKLYYLPYMIFTRMQKDTPSYEYANSHFSAHEKRKEVIYPCVDWLEFYSKEKKKQVCVIGRISPEKNLEETIRILNNVKHPCIIFGNVTAPNKMYFEKLKNMAKDHIRFESGPRDNLKELLAESKIIFTSSKETFGITTIEGIASGCIPIVPDNTAHQETVIFPYLRYDSEQRAVDIINLEMENIDRKLIGFLQQSIERFSFDTFKTKWLNAIEKALKYGS